MAAVFTATLQAQVVIDSARLRFRSVHAVRVPKASLRVDGKLDEQEWTQAFADARYRISEFSSQGPQPGSVPPDSTVAVVAFDEEAVYVAVRAYDPHPDSIIAPFMRRDDEARSDWIFVELDTRHDRRNGFSLGVNPRGVQVDGLWVDDVNYDVAWNGVWEARTRTDSLGWTAEFRIPFSQLRSASSVDASGSVTWGLNVYRHIAHSSSSSDWSPRLPSHGGRVISHFNDLLGIQLPASAHPLELTPFLSGESSPHSALSAGASHVVHPASVSGGGDIIAHLPAGLTLDATIRPDFGQVEADPSQINLTTFETYQAERRPFFVNGGDLFHFDLGVPFTTRGDGFDSDQAFYTRRIGAPPRGGVPSSAIASDMPIATNVLAAAKISGRLQGGWTVGALAAQTASTLAPFVDTRGVLSSVLVEPRTLSFATRVVHDFREGQSAVSAFVAVAEHSGMSPALDSILPKGSLFAGIDARHRIGEYELSGMAGGSHVRGTPHALNSVQFGPGHFLGRSDATYAHYDSTASSVSGAVGRLRYGKVDGAFTWSATGYAVSPTFDVSEAGFQRNADWILLLGSASYRQDLDRSHRVRSWNVSTDGSGLGWNFGGEKRSEVVSASLSAELWNYRGGSFSLVHEGRSAASELLRGGATVFLPSRWSVSGTVHTDSRRATTMLLFAAASRSQDAQSSSYAVSPSLTSRVNDRLAVSASLDAAHAIDAYGFLASLTDAHGARRWTLASLRTNSFSVVGRADYSFSAKLTLQAYLQPYFGSGAYSDVKIASVAGAHAEVSALGTRATRSANGALAIDLQDGAPPSIVANPDFTLRELHGSAVMRWEYLPGSELYIVWTQSRSGIDGSGVLHVRSDPSELFRIAPRNVILVKVSRRIVP